MPQSPAHLQPIAPGDFWRSLSSRAVGASVVTSLDGDAPVGFFALSVTHLSADPPSLMVSVSHTTSALAGIRQSGLFTVNYLAQGQQDVADVFAGKKGVDGRDRFQYGSWGRLQTGAPALGGAIGVIDCIVEEEIVRAGGVIIVGSVIAYENRDGTPLVHFRGSFQV